MLEGDALARTDWPDYERLVPVRPLSEQVVGVIGLGRIGPVTEGMAIFLIGMVFLAFTTLWIAGKS